MNIVQKKAYIEKLKVKAQSMNNSTYTKFLNECVQKYKAELCGNLPKPVPQETLVISKKKEPPFIIIIIAVIMALIVIAGVCITLAIACNGNIVGTWELETRDSDFSIIYEFKSNGTFSYRYDNGTPAYLGGRMRDICWYSGTYTISGKQLLLYIDLDSVYFEGIGGIAQMELNNYLDSDDEYIEKKVKFNFGGNTLIMSNKDGGSWGKYCRDNL